MTQRPPELFELLADEYARAILSKTTETPRSATMLADALDAAPSTVYDRIDRLHEAGFLESHQEIDETGNHYATYSATLERIEVRLTRDGFAVTSTTADRDVAADRLSDLWGEL